MKKLHLDRLRKLADHLHHGKLGHLKFDFSAWNMGAENPDAPVPNCGTSGCAVGECPIVFPKMWAFGEDDLMPQLRRFMGNRFGSPFLSARAFFGLSRDDATFLFIPRDKYDWRTVPGQLPTKASRKAVAANIRKFVRRMSAKKRKAAK